jgi:hypothetical protein
LGASNNCISGLISYERHPLVKIGGVRVEAFLAARDTKLGKYRGCEWILSLFVPSGIVIAREIANRLSCPQENSMANPVVRLAAKAYDVRLARPANEIRFGG